LSDVSILPELYELYKSAILTAEDTKESFNRLHLIGFVLDEFSEFPKEMVNDLDK